MSSVIIKGDTSGYATIEAPAAAGTPTLTLPTVTGTFLTTASTIPLTSVTGTLGVANGGTGATSLTANNVVLGNGTSAVQVVAPGTSGNVLTSNGTTWASAAPTLRKNAIINGDFNVWQRGTSFSSVASGTFVADRWQYAKVGAMVHDISRSTDVPTVAEAGRLFNYSTLVDCTTVDSSIAASDFTFVQQIIEGYNFLPLAQRAMTLSFWVKATKTGTYCVALRNAGADRSYIAEYTVNTTETWEEKTLSITASPSAGTWDYTNGQGLQVSWSLAAGTTYQTTAGSWQTGNFLASSNQVNATDSTSNNFRLCGVQLEVGSTATDFEQILFGDELALCERYYSTATVVMDSAVNGTTTVRQMTWLYVVPMRTTPTLTVTGTNGSPTVSASDNKTLQAYSTATTTFMGFTYAASAEL